MTTRSLEKFVFTVAAMFVLAAVSHSQSDEPQRPRNAAEPAKNTPALSEQAKKGKLLFNDYCYRCHQVDSDRAKPLGPMGPELAGIFKRPKLIVGKPVTEANVKEVIETGPTPGMPGFRYTLSVGQIDQVIEYLKVK